MNLYTDELLAWLRETPSHLLEAIRDDAMTFYDRHRQLPPHHVLHPDELRIVAQYMADHFATPPQTTDGVLVLDGIPIKELEFLKNDHRMAVEHLMLKGEPYGTDTISQIKVTVAMRGAFRMLQMLVIQERSLRLKTKMWRETVNALPEAPGR